MSQSIENLPKLEQRLHDMQVPTPDWTAPQPYDLASDLDRRSIEKLLETGEITRVHDAAAAIADDLYDWNHPNQLKDGEARQSYVDAVMAQESAYGTWFHFPWSKELVRYPDRDDHRMIRTSRNRNLITIDEQRALFGANVAVFGLSVGSNILDKLVISGIGGKVIMGDPDVIDPSNLNRIPGSFTDVGSSKIDLMARKISGIDPYIDQVHFRDGISKSNLAELTEHNPTILFDEVDDLAAKALMRMYAEKSGIPLIMATDLGDRSLIDIERYDLGDAKPFHGKLSKKDVIRLSEGAISDDEKRKFTAKIVGMRHVTARMLSSVMEIEKSLPGMPQLGVTAALGGSLATIAAREIILGRRIDNGRYVCSPKDIFDLPAQASVRQGISVVRTFLKSSKQSE